MSQSEVLMCLFRLGGKAPINKLADEYNKVHFPRNENYQLLSIYDVKKTMQGDTAKLLRDRVIERKVEKARIDSNNVNHRQVVWYEITVYGYSVIESYNIEKTLAYRIGK